jgi:hypothetical protein
MPMGPLQGLRVIEIEGLGHFEISLSPVYIEQEAT